MQYNGKLSHKTAVSLGTELERLFASMKDDRRKHGNFKHELKDILMLLVVSRLCGMATREQVVRFGKANLVRFRKLNLLRNGVPSEPTLCRVENGIDDEELSGILLGVARLMRRKKFKVNDMETVAIDGKCLRGTTYENGRSPDVLSANSNGLSVATELCQEKSNEIPASEKLLAKVDVAGKVVTADAMFCQRTVIEAIKARNGHFLIEVKGNQKQLRWDIEDKVEAAEALDEYAGEAELSHGRIETRACTTFSAETIVDMSKWSGSLTIVKIEKRTTDNKSNCETSEVRYYTSDLSCNAKTFNDLVRSHWGIEAYHWCLDAIMGEDGTKRKKARAGRNHDTLLRLCLSIVRIKTASRKCLEDRVLSYKRTFDSMLNDFTAAKNLLY